MKFLRVLLSCVAATVLALSAQLAQADSLTIDEPDYRDGTGGEFKITGYDYAWLAQAPAVLDPPGTNDDDADFFTFCLEKSTDLGGFGAKDYTVDAGPDDAASSTIAKETAMLAYTFWANKWSVASGLGYTHGYNYSDSTARGDDGKALQWAIWKLQGEYTGTLTGTALEYYNYATDSALDWDDLDQDGWSGAGDARALNLFNGTTHRQSQLVFVPLPAAALAGLAVLAALAVFAGLRRRNQHSFQ